MVLHVNAYMAGSHTGFEGSDMYLVACCGICTFAALEPVSGANATTFASAIMKIQLCYEFCHTIILDKDKKFCGVCRKALDLLKINCHVLSGGNHNPMLVERLCCYFNKGLTIMCNERDTVQNALECLLLLLYAWNSCLVPGTNISRSLVAVGCKFAFPIDYSGVSIGSSHHHRPQSRVTPRSSPHGSARAAKLPNCLFWSSANDIVRSSTPVAPTPKSIHLAILCLPRMPHGQMLPRDLSASSSTNLPAHGASSSPSKELHTPLSIA
jgi:hypothetical protein